jgi:hypothetical protein
MGVEVAAIIVVADPLTSVLLPASSMTGRDHSQTGNWNGDADAAALGAATLRMPTTAVAANTAGVYRLMTKR